MKDILILFVEILDSVTVLAIAVMYCLSIKKCFWKGDKAKVKLFFLTMFTNPVLLYILTLAMVICITDTIGIKDIMNWSINTNFIYRTFISTIIYLLIVFYSSSQIGKWLGAPNKELVSFVSMMYSVILLLVLRNDISNLKNTSDNSYVIDIMGYILLPVAAVLLYVYVINALTKLTDKRRKINSKMFNVPLTIFTVFYNIVALSAMCYLNTMACILIRLFSTIILFLLIWAFYVIIKNINATNEAIEAKDMAAAAARMEARIEADLAIAKEIQTSALPNVFPPFPERTEFDLFACMNAAKEVGGDFYDFYMLNENTLGFLIADVSGKSFPGAMFMMKSKTLIKGLAESGLTPAQVFTLANEKLCEGNEAEMFVTAWLGYLDLKTGLVEVANAGHNPPVMIHDGKAEYLILKPGLMLAGMEYIRYKQQTVQLRKGDILFLYTDGVTEAMDKDENQYGEDRLKKILSFGEKYSEGFTENQIAESVCKAVRADIEQFTDGAEQSDDITMLCIRYN